MEKLKQATHGHPTVFEAHEVLCFFLSIADFENWLRFWGLTYTHDETARQYKTQKKIHDAQYDVPYD